mmetsp:Transcript_83143/g.144478  ORF Transcript_83143/g.144478 Transcript_83143/m.144478 type:complete len:367 (-) Transcript_83143:195-1295(-)
MTYPHSFEQAASAPLEESLPVLEPGSLRKVRTLCDAIYGKVKLVASNLPNMPPSFVVKQMPKAVFQNPCGIECPRNEIHASLAIGQDLQVPHIAKVLFAAQDEKFFYLATEYCAHGELLTLVNTAGRLQGDTVLREVLLQILGSVKVLHENGIAHRDLSLENFLVDADGEVRLIDWAQAVLVHPKGQPEKEARVSQVDGPPGKPHYQGPELAGGRMYLATKADMFAIGIMLFALATGTYPFPPKCGNDQIDSVDLFPPEEACAARCRHLGRKLQKSPGNLKDCVSPGCLDLLEQLLAPNPELRISAEEALMHPWLTGAISDLWLLADTRDSTSTSAGSTDSSGEDDDFEMMGIDCSDSISCGVIAN